MRLLDVLQESRTQILLLEFSTLIHDLDKLRGAFLNDPDAHSFKTLRHRKEEETSEEKRRELWADTSLGELTLQLPVRERQVPYPAAAEVKLDSNNAIELGDAFIFHHDLRPQKPHPFISHLIHPALGGCDGIDSALDKNTGNEGTQTSHRFFIDTPFGFSTTETKATSLASDENHYRHVIAMVQSLVKTFADSITSPSLEKFTIDQAHPKLKPELRKALGETRYPINDVTLWSHSYSVAALCKALFAKVLIEESQPVKGPYLLPSRGGQSDAERKPNNQTDFAYCRVTLDRPYMWSRAVKAGDVMGIADQVDRLQSHLEQFFATKILAGNQVYRDQESVVFLIPKLGTWVDAAGTPQLPVELHRDFEGEIRESLQDEILIWTTKNHCEDLPFAITFSSGKSNNAQANERMLDRSERVFKGPVDCRQNPKALLSVFSEYNSAGQSRGRMAFSQCKVCGLRPQRSAPPNEELDLDICDKCRERRRNTNVRKQRNLGENLTSDLETMTPENRLALIRFTFDLTPIYESKIFEKVEWTTSQKKDGVIATKSFKKNPSPGRLHRTWMALTDLLEESRNIASKVIAESAERRTEIQGMPFEVETGGGLFPVTLTPTPDRMEFIVPASLVMEIITKVYDEYEKRIGKFRECMPLSIGCVFFYKKYPLYVVMDAMRNMAESLTTTEDAWSVKQAQGHSGYRELHVTPPNHGKTGSLAGWAAWRVPTTLSDGRYDMYHPKFRTSEDEPSNYVHVTDIKAGDQLKHVREGWFDFILADSAQSRFAFRGGTRRHHILGERPAYPLSSVREFQRIHGLLVKLTPSQISAIEGTLVEKMLAWKHQWFSSNPETEVTVRHFCELIVMAPNAFGARTPDKRFYRHFDCHKGGDPQREADYQKTNPNSERNLLINAACNGVLLDVIDVYEHLQDTTLGAVKHAPQPAANPAS